MKKGRLSLSVNIFSNRTLEVVLVLVDEVDLRTVQMNVHKPILQGVPQARVVDLNLKLKAERERGDENAGGGEKMIIRTRSFSARSNGVNERLVRATMSERLMFSND